MTDSYHMGFKDGQQSLIDQGYEKIRHGRWIDNTPTTDEYGNPLSMVADPFKYIDLTCSVCGRKATTKTDYCPNCGAVMDLTEDSDG